MRRDRGHLAGRWIAPSQWNATERGIAFSSEESDQLRASLETLKQILYPKLVSLDSDGRRELLKMGDKSETFCRQTLELLAKNRKLVPEDFDLDGDGRTGRGWTWGVRCCPSCSS